MASEHPVSLLIEQDGGKLAAHYANSSWSHALYADEMLLQGRTSEAVETYKEVAESSTVFERQVFFSVLLQMRALTATREEPLVSPLSITQVLSIIQPSTEQNPDIYHAPVSMNHASSNLDSRPVRFQMVCNCCKEANDESRRPRSFLLVGEGQ
jgi:hypothetical protein